VVGGREWLGSPYQEGGRQVCGGAGRMCVHAGRSVGVWGQEW